MSPEDVRLGIIITYKCCGPLYYTQDWSQESLPERIKTPAGSCDEINAKVGVARHVARCLYKEEPDTCDRMLYDAIMQRLDLEVRLTCQLDI